MIVVGMVCHRGFLYLACHMLWFNGMLGRKIVFLEEKQAFSTPTSHYFYNANATSAKD